MAAAAADRAVAATGADWFGFVFPTRHEVVVFVCVRRLDDWQVVFSPSVVCHQAGGRREESGRKAGGRREDGGRKADKASAMSTVNKSRLVTKHGSQLVTRIIWNFRHHVTTPELLHQQTRITQYRALWLANIQSIY